MSRTNIRFVVFLTLICLTAAVVPASAQQFQQITGTPLSQIAAGRKEVWGLYNSQIYRFNPGTETFRQIPGSLAQIAVGGGTLSQADEVWGLDSSGSVYRFNFAANAFEKYQQGRECKFCLFFSLSQIAVGAGYDDPCHPYEVWGINFMSFVYRYNYCSSQFENIPTSFSQPPGVGIGFKQIAANGAGDVWALYEYESSASGLWEYAGAWYNLGVIFQQIAVGVNDVWALDSSGGAWFWPAIPTIITDGAGHDRPFGPLPLPSQGFATQIATGGDGVWVIYNDFSADVQGGQIARYDFQHGGFVNVPLPTGTAAVQVAVGSGAGVWVLDASDEVFTFVRPLTYATFPNWQLQQ